MTNNALRYLCILLAPVCKPIVFRFRIYLELSLCDTIRHHTVRDNGGMQSLKHFQDTQTIKNWVSNCFLGGCITFFSECGLTRMSLIMVYKYTSEEHLLSLKFHLVQSVIYFIEVLYRRTSPFIFIVKVLFILARYIVLKNFYQSVPLFLYLLIIAFSVPISLQKPLQGERVFLFNMKAIVSVGGCPNNEIVKSYFHCHCSYLCSGVQVAFLYFYLMYRYFTYIQEKH